MRLLFDQNLSPALAVRRADIFPDSLHTENVGLGTQDDAVIWDFAGQQGFTIVSKDADFHARSMLLGPPPKFIWLRVGNCPVKRIEDVVRVNSAVIHTFGQNPNEAFIILR